MYETGKASICMSFILNVAKIGLVVEKLKGDAVMGRISH
jgi:hypothetical protein